MTITRETPLASCPEFLTVQEVGILLGVDRNTAYAMVASGQVPSVRFSVRILRVPRAALAKYAMSEASKS